jgi:DNA-binding transcriptional ArsR family regulator
MRAYAVAMSDEPVAQGARGSAPYPRDRQAPTVREAKALAHPLRLRILRLCEGQELTNKQLADRLERDPATVHYHVRQLLKVGFLEPVPPRTGESGALEKPYRSTRATWWLDNPLAEVTEEPGVTLFELFRGDLADAGPDALQWVDRFVLHLSEEDVQELERRILAVLDEYVATDDERRHHPTYGGIVVLHRSADGSERDAP